MLNQGSNKKRESKFPTSNLKKQILSDLDCSDTELNPETTLQSADEDETFQRKRLRLAKNYLNKVQNQERDGNELQDLVKRAVTHISQCDMATGSQDKLIHIWNPETVEVIHTFTGHRKSVTGLAFCKGTLDLYSASEDCSVKIWNLAEMVYVETLFGHHGAISAIDALAHTWAITAGRCDRTIRIWKIMEESQLVFTGHKGAIDNVQLINEKHFISCGDDGSIALWGVMKKKPLVVVLTAHGTGPNTMANWITSIAVLQNTNLIASGSCDGYIHLWKCGIDYRTLTKVNSIHIDGFINALQFSFDGNFLVAAVGQEHRLGRWWKMKVKNRIVIISLK